MKNIKKLFINVLTLVLMLCSLNNVNASTGSITIDDVTIGKEYELYKIFDLTYSKEGTKTNASYTISSNWNNFFTTTGSSYLVDTDTTSTLNKVVIGSTVKYINITESNISNFANDALNYVKNLTPDKSITVTSENINNKSIKITGLSLGYYLVYPKGATDIKTGNASIASLTSTTPDATIKVKAVYPDIKKTVDKHTFDVGNYATFTIKGLVPDTTGYNGNGAFYDYIITDTWSKGLELDKNNVDFTIKFVDKSQNKETTITNVTPVYNTNNKGFTLTFDMTKYQEHKGEEIVITYKLKVTKDAIITIAKNKATLTYSNNPKDREEKKTTPPQEDYVYSSKIIVTKVDGTSCTIKDNNETCTKYLEGASFVLKNNNGKYYKQVLDNQNNLTEVIWVDSINDATTLTTLADGVVEFTGLQDGSYSLIETKAPDGYNKLTGPVTVTVTTTSENNQIVPVASTPLVKNYTGKVLPSTGGVGSTIFVVVGTLLTLVSLLVIITNKRISKEDL